MTRTRVVSLAGRLPGAERARRNRPLRELMRRTGFEPPNPRPAAPPHPVGAKLELTYSCNLRCGFCYTDSPRRTLERATDLTDEQWDRVVSDVIDVGVVEAVVTGGEPLLRAELALRTVERLDRSGIATTLNTNGWFVDEDVADRIGGLDLVTVNISLDGPTPEVHDRARGVPGSWRRAVRAMSLLVERSVPVRVVHVVTPDNQALVPEVIAQVRTLGATALRVTPVVEIGAAARERAWRVDSQRLRRVVERARREGGDLEIRLERESLTGDPIMAPAYFVVRPNGAVMAGSLTPFRFGHAIEDGLSECWRRITRDWRHPQIEAWREPVLAGKPISEMPVVMYRDEEVDVYGSPDPSSPAPPGASSPATVREPGAKPPLPGAKPPLPGAKPPLTGAIRLPKPAARTQVAGDGDLASATAFVRQLVLGRCYEAAPIRWTPAEEGRRYVRNALGGVTLLNGTASAVMDACSPGTGSDAVARLLRLYPDASRDRIEQDAVITTHRLVRGGILVYSATSSSSPRSISASATAAASG